MRYFTHFFYALIIFLFVEGCDNKPVNQEAIKDEMANRELKRIPEGDILQKGMELGDTIAIEAQQLLQKNLLNAIQEGGVAHALQFCNANALDLVKDLEEEGGYQIMRVSDKYRNPMDAPDSLENLILEAYQYNAEEGLPLEASIQSENAEVLLYTKPITIAGGLCLNCHGTIGQELSEANYDSILGYYPEDKAVGYALNDLRGMWVIRIPRKTVVK